MIPAWAGPINIAQSVPSLSATFSLPHASAGIWNFPKLPFSVQPPVGACLFLQALTPDRPRPVTHLCSVFSSFWPMFKPVSYSFTLPGCHVLNGVFHVILLLLTYVLPVLLFFFLLLSVDL